MRALAKPLTLLSNVFLFLGAAAATILMLHVVLDVVAKLVVRQPIVGTLEMVSDFYMVAVVFLPLAAAQRDRAHIIIELFTHNLRPRVNAAIDGAAGLLTLALVGALFVTALDTAIAKTLIGEQHISPIFPVDIWPGRWIVVVGMFGFAIFLLVHIVNDLVYAITGRAGTVPIPTGKDTTTPD